MGTVTLYPVRNHNRTSTPKAKAQNLATVPKISETTRYVVRNFGWLVSHTDMQIIGQRVTQRDPNFKEHKDLKA